MTTWTEEMKEELQRATDHYEAVCDEDIEYYRLKCVAERNRRIDKARRNIEIEAANS